MRKLARVLVLFAAFAATVDAICEEQNAPATASEQALPVFRPKNLGAPRVRIGGGSRGQDQADIELLVLAPEETGFTTTNQPKLYWYISTSVNKPIEITVMDKLSVVLKLELIGSTQAGIQTINLADHGLILQPDTKYKWSIAIINNPKQRSADTFASAGLQLIPMSKELTDKLMLAQDTKSKIGVYLDEGIWYDAFSTIQNTNASMSSNEVIKIRSTLLQQVRLPALE